MNPTPERFLWAARLLNIHPSDHLLEIGCGTGVLVSLISPLLDEGIMVGIDRSAPLIRKAEEKYSDLVASGTAAFQACSLEEARFGSRRFDKIIAFNFPPFQKKGSREPSRLKRLFRPGGQLYLFHQQPLPSRTAAVTDALTGVLRENGYTIVHTESLTLLPAPAVCIRAVPAT